jgi:NADH-quinone oxidoreductase subunit J
MTITIQQLVFYSFSILAISSSLMMILSKNPVKSVLHLVFTFFCMAGIWMLLESEFLAIVLVLVYVGAVMVLFLFVVMMLDIEVVKKEKDSFVKYWPIGVITACVTIVLLFMAVGKKHFGIAEVPMPLAKAIDYSNVKVLGNLLYTDFLLPFEIAGVILLVAMIAAIALTFRGPRDTKTQKPAQQTLVRKSDRLRIVKMQSEGRENP